MLGRKWFGKIRKFALNGFDANLSVHVTALIQTLQIASYLKSPNSSGFNKMHTFDIEINTLASYNFSLNSHDVIYINR